MRTLPSLLIVAVSMLSCSSPPRCRSDAECPSTASCNATLSECVLRAEDAGASDAGAEGSDAGLADAGPGDAGMVRLCQPNVLDGGNGCAPTERCTWVVLSDQPMTGRSQCVAPGFFPAGAVCQRADAGASGFDHCVAGTVCVEGVCRRICDLGDRTSCGLDNCAAYQGLFENPDGGGFETGACLEGCNPLTQLTTGNVPCGPNRGCYLVGTIALCARAGTIEHGGAIDSGIPFANVCVPGAKPRRATHLSSIEDECGGLCAVVQVDTSGGALDEGGVAPNSCSVRWSAPAPNDADAGESCRFRWLTEPVDPMGERDRFINSIGTCFRHATWEYDSDGDAQFDAPFPRCTSVDAGDESFGCSPLPPMKRATSSGRGAVLHGWR